MKEQQASIVSGSLGDPEHLIDYRAILLGGILVERAVWGQLVEPVLREGTLVADSGYIWFRFWLPSFDQVVERYYTPEGQLVGTHIDLCGPLECDAGGCRARDYILNLWIDREDFVTLRCEEEFEQAVARSLLSAGEVENAEGHLRALTAAIAQGHFPPAMVRNWQIDPGRIPEP